MKMDFCCSNNAIFTACTLPQRKEWLTVENNDPNMLTERCGH